MENPLARLASQLVPEAPAHVLAPQSGATRGQVHGELCPSQGPHAAQIPAVARTLQWVTWAHLPSSDLSESSLCFQSAACSDRVTALDEVKSHRYPKKGYRPPCPICRCACGSPEAGHTNSSGVTSGHTGDPCASLDGGATVAVRQVPGQHTLETAIRSWSSGPGRGPKWERKP